MLEPVSSGRRPTPRSLQHGRKLWLVARTRDTKRSLSCAACVTHGDVRRSVVHSVHRAQITEAALGFQLQIGKAA